MKIHGDPVIGFLTDRLDPNESVVLVDIGDKGFERYVTGRVATHRLHEGTVTEWFWGHYHMDLADAMGSLLDRAGWKP